jgi:hypothetical protein
MGEDVRVAARYRPNAHWHDESELQSAASHDLTVGRLHLAIGSVGEVAADTVRHSSATKSPRWKRTAECVRALDPCADAHTVFAVGDRRWLPEFHEAIKLGD